MMTGLTDAMRSDFRLMQAVANITRISPQARVDRTYQFLKRIKANPEVHIYLHSLFLRSIAILGVILMLLLREQITTFWRVYHLCTYKRCKKNAMSRLLSHFFAT